MSQAVILACTEQVLWIARAQGDLDFLNDKVLEQGIARYRSEAANLMGLANPEVEGLSFSDCEAQLAQVQISYVQVKEALLHAGAELCTTIPGMIGLLEQNCRIRHMARQMAKVMRYLNEVYTVAEVRMPAVSEPNLADT